MIIVTGGAGFIGSATIKKLNDSGIEQILVVDNLGSSDKWKNLVGKKFSDYIHKDEFIKLIENQANFGDAEAVIHFGACSATTEQDADYLIRNNFHYSRALAEWALARDIRFIYASSAATYGDGALGFSDDNDTTYKIRPLNKYGFSKHLFDLWVLNNKLEGKVTGLKFFNVFGPNEYHKGDMRSLINKAFFQIRETGKVRLFKSHRDDYRDGEQVRDFVYIKDCLEVIWWFLRNPKTCGIYNLGTGNARSWNDLVKSIFSALGQKHKIEYIDMPEAIRNAYQYHTEAKMEKLRSAGYPISFLSLEDSVKDYVCAYLQNDCSHL
ncbi:ADP-glyceromanno-heptose 6-epimerase [bacterium]|nr:ADP-glyceromanno-heptose 6-epimerase [bacterium]